jgi:hypothetical protein
MRRHDYTVDVLGGATEANYTTNYKDVQGIKIPTTRRGYAYDGNDQMIPDPLLVSIDIESVILKKWQERGPAASNAKRSVRDREQPN